MSIGNTGADFYYDMSGFDRMRAQARKDPNKSLEVVAKQFESVFVKMMMDSMRDATFGDPLLGSETTKFYQDMYDEQLSLELTKNGSIGLADVLVKQLEHTLPGSGKKAAKDDNAGNETANVQPLMPRGNAMRALEKYRNTQHLQAEPAIAQNVAVKHVSPAKEFNVNSPEEFVKAVWGDAKDAAAKIGVKPEVLIAQAALETGWGKHVIKREDGGSSYNLFNIKADSRWDGASVRKESTEYYNGKRVMETSSFRAYDDIKQSFRDYVEFLSNSPRYRKALANAENPQRYLDELQRAGYATDPRYAEKIDNIMNRDYVKHTVARLRMMDVNTVASINS